MKKTIKFSFSKDEVDTLVDSLTAFRDNTDTDDRDDKVLDELILRITSGAIYYWGAQK